MQAPAHVEPVEIRRHGGGELGGHRRHGGPEVAETVTDVDRGRVEHDPAPGPNSSTTSPLGSTGVVTDIAAWLNAPPSWVHVIPTTPRGSPTAASSAIRPERDLQRIEHVRSEVQQPAPLQAPRRGDGLPGSEPPPRNVARPPYA